MTDESEGLGVTVWRKEEAEASSKVKHHAAKFNRVNGWFVSCFSGTFSGIFFQQNFQP